MAIQTDKIFMRNSATGHERLLLLASKDQTYAWDSPLLKDVEEIVIQQPQILWYQKDAGPFLVCPKGAELVDSGDLKVDPREREPTCAGIWPVQGADRPRVLVLAGGVVHDCYQGMTGELFPGITRNRAFARNLIHWLANAELELPTSQSDAATTVRAIEVGLHVIVKAILEKEFGPNCWKTGVPKQIRIEASQRHEAEDGNFSKEANLYLLNLKEIVEKQWKLFGTLFEEVRGKGKSNSLQWVVQLNEIRNRTAHPLKLRERPMNSEELLFLRDRLRFVQNLGQKCGLTA